MNRKILVATPFYALAAEYLRMVEAEPGTHKIVSEPEQLRALSPEDHVVVLEGPWQHRVIEQIEDMLTVSRAQVEHVDVDRMKGIFRHEIDH